MFTFWKKKKQQTKQIQTWEYKEEKLKKGKKIQRLSMIDYFSLSRQRTHAFILLTVWVLPWKTLHQHFATAPYISHSLLPPLSQLSLSNDRSITATICGDVIFFEGEREGLALSICSGTFHCFNICMAVRQTTKPPFFFLPLNRRTFGRCETNVFS